MPRRRSILLTLPLAAAIFLPALKAQNSENPSTAPLTDAQIRALVARTLTNEHADDLLLEQYSRTEHDQVRAEGHGLSDKDTVTRIIPTGTGDAHVELEKNGVPTTAAKREDGWKAVVEKLSDNVRTDDPEIKKDYERASKRRRDRVELVDAIAKAFRYRFVRRENLNGRTVALFSFEPEPGFHTTVRYAGICAKVHGMVWVDENAAQLVRVDAEMFDDYSFVAGIVAKVYQGSRMILEQSEIEPGVWLPTHIQLNLQGRKFLFSASLHETIDDRDYRRVGLPREALQAIGLERADGNKDAPKVLR